MTIAPGTKLGPYEILAHLGSGGMGQVWRARDGRLDRDVAVKLLPPSLAGDPERLQRFALEARAAGQLNHPNVLTVYDIGTEGGTTYLVTELLDGETLRERMSAGALPVRKIVDIAKQIGLGLSAAHGRGIVHRDLKPENVFVTRDGRVKILDFGLARVTIDSSAEASAATTLQGTTPGMILGTVGYMSPEQVRGQPADARSDLFSFGSVLFEMATGRRAFERATAADTMSAILKEDPPDITLVGAAIPAALDRLIRRCLEKSPDERFQSARDLAFALEATDGTSTSGATTATYAAAPGPSTRSRLPVWIAISLIAALGGGFLIGRLGAPTAVAPGFSPTTARLQQLTSTGGDIGQPSLSADGATVVYTLRSGGNSDIYSLRVGGENAVNLTADSPAHDSQPAFSPDGRAIAFRSERGGGGIFVMGATGESVRRITSEGFHPAWSPDGRELAYTHEAIGDPNTRTMLSPLYRVVVATGATTKVSDGDAAQPAWSPNGKFLVFWGLPAGSGRRAIFTIAAAGGTPTTLVDDGAINWNPVWSNDGEYVYFASDREPPMNLWRIPVDQQTGAARGAPERLTLATEVHYGLSAEANGAVAFPAVNRQSVVERHVLDLANPRPDPAPAVLMRLARGVSSVAPSPDGRLLAMTINDGTEDLVVTRADGTGSTRLTNDIFRDRAPTWTAAGDAIFFMSDRSGRYEIWRIRPDGSSLEPVTEQAADKGMPIAEPILSADGKWLAALTFGTKIGAALIDLAPPLAARVVRVVQPPDVPFPARPVGWLANGHMVLAPADPGAAPAVAIYSPADNKTVRVVPTPGFEAGRVAGERYVLGGTAKGRLGVLDLSTGTIRAGAEVDSAPFVSGTPAADGKFIYTTRYETVTNLWLLRLTKPTVSAPGSAGR